MTTSTQQLEGVWGHAPPETFSGLGALRSLLRPFWTKTYCSDENVFILRLGGRLCPGISFLFPGLPFLSSLFTFSILSLSISDNNTHACLEFAYLPSVDLQATLPLQ